MRTFVRKALDKELVKWQDLIKDLASERLAHAMQKQK